MEFARVNFGTSLPIEKFLSKVRKVIDLQDDENLTSAQKYRQSRVSDAQRLVSELNEQNLELIRQQKNLTESNQSRSATNKQPQRNSSRRGDQDPSIRSIQ